MIVTDLHPTLDVLCELANDYELAPDSSQLVHRLGKNDNSIDEIDLCRAALWSGLQARVVEANIDELQALPLPALVLMDEQWRLVKRISPKTVEIVDQHRRLNLEVEAFKLTYQGKVLVARANFQAKEKIAFGFGWFIPAIKKHKRQFSWVIGVSLMIQLIALVSPLLFQNVIDKVLVSRSLSSLEVLGVAMLGLAVMGPLYGLLRSWLFSNLSSKIGAELSSKLYDHLTALPLSYFNERQTGQIIARMKEMDSIRQFLTGSGLTLILDLAFIGLFIGVMLMYSSLLTSVVVISLVLYFLFWILVGKGLRTRVNHAFEAEADATAMLTESVMGIETVKTTATEWRFNKHWQEQLAHFTKASFAATNYGNWAGQGICLIQKLTAALLLWLGVKLVLDGALTSGELVAFNMFAGHVTQPILRLAQIWQDFQHTLISLRRVGDILDVETESGSEGLASVAPLKGKVAFDNVRFRYCEQSPDVLRGLSITIEPGEFVGITGPSGSGKSTLTKLLQRLYSPTQGQVLIDGLDLAIADPVQLRRQMSVVLQENHLFSGTVAENIRLNCPEASDEDVRNAAELAGVIDFIGDLPQGFNSPVGEKGALLSGGQRQRIALARALISNPSVLILDEATSALDYESEAAIMSNMTKICEGRTVISIAHRLGTIKNADRILVINDGRISEEGEHNFLIQEQGLYKHLWEIQSGFS
ncbi:type I secretion system permease/ATPase [Vibrio mimicus]